MRVLPPAAFHASHDLRSGDYQKAPPLSSPRSTERQTEKPNMKMQRLRAGLQTARAQFPAARRITVLASLLFAASVSPAFCDAPPVPTWHFEYQNGSPVKLVWQTSVGQICNLMVSSDLASWTPAAGFPQTAIGETLEYPFVPAARGFFRIIPVSAEFALIPAGPFQMGDALDEGRTDELPVREVFVGAFYLARCELTQARWDEVRIWALAAVTTTAARLPTTTMWDSASPAGQRPEASHPATAGSGEVRAGRSGPDFLVFPCRRRPEIAPPQGGHAERASPAPPPWIRPSLAQSLCCTFPDHPQTAAMELDILDIQFDLRHIKPRELEEAFEDPFSVRFLPDNERADGATRYYALGRTVADRYLFLSFRTDGKATRVVAAREMSDTEKKFYDRKYAEFR